jgi:plasmid stabilization system protein ParE
MSRARVATTELFHEDLARVSSKRVLKLVAQALINLAAFPDMGRVARSPSLTSRFGEGVRTLVCGKYLLVYRHAEDAVQALALYPARIVR